MPDLGYALDALYSAGWWPRETQQSIQSSDGRWMPELSEILTAFDEAGYQIRLHEEAGSAHSRVDWAKWGGIQGSAIGRDKTEALLIAYSELLRIAPMGLQSS